MAKSGIGGRENRLISGVGIAVLCLVATTLILAVVPQDDPRVSAVRQVFFDAVTPALELFGKPADALTNIGDYLDELDSILNLLTRGLGNQVTAKIKNTQLISPYSDDLSDEQEEMLGLLLLLHENPD